MAAFLRGRRARVTPGDVGMPPGLRRRTPGLRREEVAQLSGVGVTWYTWLEQGRPINASAQVLDAVARTLRLDPPEREHLYHLAEVPFAAAPEALVQSVGPEIQGIIDALSPRPAVVYNSRYDILAANGVYRDLFIAPAAEPAARVPANALRGLFALREEESPLLVQDKELLQVMVATLRASYGLHAGEPVWEDFICGLSQASPLFARLWASGDVAEPGPRVKAFRHEAVGELRMTSTSLSINGMPECRIVVYTPDDEETARRTALLRKETTKNPAP
ncbi:helix-turn-helix transcriptional regulator [Streptomyces rishiriensis]|uniref:helix-turn-helix transcriptional regulator n=1 Tax=Streptomyces rishiriensis TaxID=68264 RepID=UPI0037D3604C